jgi:hypothetical protein
MSRNLSRFAYGVAALAFLFACTVNISFDYSKTGVQVAIVASAVNEVIPIDLSTQPDVQAHKNNVESFSLDSVDATISSAGSGCSAMVLNGSMYLRPDGGPTDGSKDVLVGALSGVALTAGTTRHLAGSAALDALMLSTIRGSGKASAVVNGTATGTTCNFTMDLKLHLSMGYG